MTAPARYCLAICWCGECPHYRPIPRERLDPNVWGTRETGGDAVGYEGSATPESSNSRAPLPRLNHSTSEGNHSSMKTTRPAPPSVT